MLKKIISTIVVSALCITTLVAPTTAKAEGTEMTSEIGVSVQATVLDVVITPSITIPVTATDAVMPKANIKFKNNTIAPVKVTLTSLTTAEGSDFSLVAPNKYPSWLKLNKTQSRDIALRITPNSFLTSSGVFYAGEGAAFTGTVDAGAMCALEVAVTNHGNAFEDTLLAKFNISFVVELE